MAASTSSPTNSVEDDWSVFGVDLCNHHEPKVLRVQVKADTGASDNLICTGSVQRAELGLRCQNVDKVTWHGVSSRVSSKIGKDLLWSGRARRKYLNGFFYVVDSCPYDMIYCMGFILRENVLVLASPARPSPPRTAVILRRDIGPQGKHCPAETSSTTVLTFK